jgi:hypothetical protein
VSLAAITLCVTSQRVIPNVSIYFVIDSVRKLLDTLSYEKKGKQTTIRRDKTRYVEKCTK